MLIVCSLSSWSRHPHKWSSSFASSWPLRPLRWQQPSHSELRRQNWTTPFLRRVDRKRCSAVRHAGSDPTAGAGCTSQHRPAHPAPQRDLLYTHPASRCSQRRSQLFCHRRRRRKGHGRRRQREDLALKALTSKDASSQSASGSYAVHGCYCAHKCAARQLRWCLRRLRR